MQLAIVFLSNTFVFNIKESESEHFSFNIRKRIQFGEQILYQNLIKVAGKMSSSVQDDSSKVEILFKQNPLVVLTKTILFGLGLLSIMAGIISSTAFIIPGIIFFCMGCILWFFINKKNDEYTEQYKRLLKELFGLE